MSRIHRQVTSIVLGVGTVWLAACGGSGSEPAPKATYRVILESAPADLGGLFVSVNTQGQKIVTFTSARTMPSGAQSGSGAFRAILIAPTLAAPIAQIVFDAPPAGTPSVSVLEASANASGQYRPILPSAVILRVEKVN